MKKLIFFTVKPLKYVILALCLSVQATPLSKPVSNGTLTPSIITKEAMNYVKTLFPAPEQGELSYQAVPLDRRIKIKPCDKQLQYSIPSNAALSKQTTVLVRCATDRPWSLYVQVKIKTLLPIVVARSSMAPGTLISAGNVTTVLKDASLVRGRVLQNIKVLAGAKTSRYISAGQAVTMRQVCLVCKGDSVTVIAKIKGLQVKTSGIAQQNGSLGDNIAILNSRTSKRIEARVVAVNRVEINI